MKDEGGRVKDEGGRVKDEYRIMKLRPVRLVIKAERKGEG
ncbi:hypothetical protein A33Q_3486 [Indibacter alkaliphilus LW1]|uniref:Uncharacterized protein n=1 Tax=Indibacter alkaliphilus (strain CCUG 57479 / KCTC 22604 / LW1) TaxID=1189612 RepID=S2DPI0_INDAL|nr:hypothetical protein A33Q_3486 [Indibacter alkaliphilus LW1]